MSELSDLTEGLTEGLAGSLKEGQVDIQPGMSLPMPDEASAMAARDRLSMIDLGVGAPTVTALGALAEAVVFIASVQGSAYPRPLLSTRVVLLTGSHSGGVVAGPAPDPRSGTPLQHLAVNAGAGIVTLEWQPAAAAIELEDAITAEQMDAGLRAGWDEAERAADEGIELLVLAAGGAGAATAASAVVAAATGAEPPVLLPRVVTPTGRYDDSAWMARCIAVRDALHRVRDRDGDPRTVLCALGGADIAAATGLLLGAAYRRTPVMIDGPIGAAGALLANDYAPQVRRWILLPDAGRHPAVILAAKALELRPWLDLCLDLGEGAASLAALPMLQTALTLAGAGEPVEDQPLTRYDTSGNQVFVGIAKAVEPVELADTAGAEEGTHEAPPADASAEPVTAAADSSGAAAADTARADSKAAPAKTAKAVLGKAAPAKPDAAKPDAARTGTPKGAPVRTVTKAPPAKAATPAKATPAKATTAKAAPAKVAPAKDTASPQPPGPTPAVPAQKAAGGPGTARGASPTPAGAGDATAPDRQAPDRQAPDRQAPDRQAPDRQAPDRQAPDSKTPDRKAATTATATDASDATAPGAKTPAPQQAKATPASTPTAARPPPDTASVAAKTADAADADATTAGAAAPATEPAAQASATSPDAEGPDAEGPDAEGPDGARAAVPDAQDTGQPGQVNTVVGATAATEATPAADASAAAGRPRKRP